MVGGKKGKGKGKEIATSNRENHHMPPTTNLSLRNTSTTPSPPPPPPPPPPQPPRDLQINKLLIRPRGDQFTKQHDCVVKISEAIQIGFNEGWRSWTKVDEPVRDMWFREFEKYFSWEEADALEIRRIFEHRGSIILKNKLANAHKNNRKPRWIGDGAWTDLKAQWSTNGFKKISDQNKRNQASDCGGQGFPHHCGGSITHLEALDRLAEERGRELKLVEGFMELHSELDENGERKWIDDRAKSTYNKFLKNWEEKCGGMDGERQETMPSEFEVWKDTVGRAKNGRIYGLAGAAAIVSGPSSFTTKWQNAKNIELKKELELVKNENMKLKETVGSLKEEWKEWQRQMSRTLTPFSPYQHRPNQVPYYPSQPGYYMPPPSYMSRPEVHHTMSSSSTRVNENHVDDDDDNDYDIDM